MVTFGGLAAKDGVHTTVRHPNCAQLEPSNTVSKRAVHDCAVVVRASVVCVWSPKVTKQCPATPGMCGLCCAVM